MNSDTPTLGAWRRTHGHTSWSEEAQHLFAVTLIQEAQRSALLERLDNIQRFLVVGATPDQAIARLADLVGNWYRP